MQQKTEPQLVTVLREGYRLKDFWSDLSAGLVVGIVAIPLAIAFAIASGVKPEQGLFTAIIAGFLISAFSGSRVQIGGPTGAFIVIIYGIIQKYGFDGLVVATMIAGALLIVMGLLKLGAIIKFIPYPVTVGFTTGIAVIIATGQIRDVFGLTMESVPAEFIEKIAAYARDFGSFNPWAFAVFAASVVVIVLWPRVNKKIPGSIIAILLATVLVQVFKLPVETIQDRFGGIAGSFPMPRLPVVNREIISEMFFPGLTIAFLAGIESLLSAVVADGMLGTKHNSNMELIAQGIANLVTPIFGGIPATGAIARTATNIKNGGRTPVAGIVHAVTILLILALFSKWAALIPMSTIAGVLIVVSYNMSEIRLFARMFKNPKSDVLVMLTTFLLTVFIDLTVAIGVGIIMALFLFMKRMSEVTQMDYIGKMAHDMDGDNSKDPDEVDASAIPEGVEVFEVNGPFFFGAADKFKDTISQIEKRPRITIIRMRKVLSVDATALRALESIYYRTKREGTIFLLSGVHTQPLFAMQKSGFIKLIGEDNMFITLKEALERSRQELALITK